MRIIAAVFACSLAASAAAADTVLEIDDDGTGFARFVLSGSFDLSGGFPDFLGASAGQSITAGLIAPLRGIQTSFVSLFRATAPAQGGTVDDFNLTAGSGLFTNGAEATDMTNTVLFENYSVEFSVRATRAGFGGSMAIFAYDAPTSGTWREDVVTSLPFALFNEGVWDFGSFGGSPNDGARLSIGQNSSVAPVPLPAGVLLSLTGLVGLGVLRRIGSS